MSGQTLLLIPGLVCDATVWAHQACVLAEFADVQIFEPGARDSLAAMAEAALERAPVRFAVAGHSMGGRVALEVLRRAPKRITGIALLDTGSQPLPQGEAGDREAAGRWRLVNKAHSEGMRAMAWDWVQNMVHPDRLADRPLIDAILDMFASKTAEHFEAQIQALLNRPDATPLLSQIRCPTLVLCGREDTWSSYQQHQEMSALIPGSTLVAVPECGHMSTMERPQAVSEALRTWLDCLD